MDYPLKLGFKIIALAPQLSVRDAAGREVLYVKQKLLKLKEKIRVFSDASQSRQLYEINADRVLDISPRLSFTDSQGQPVGSVKRRGARSLWKASYEIEDAAGRVAYVLEEGNPWVKLLDGLIGEIPLVGAFTGYFLNPTYDVRRAGASGDGAVLKVLKHRSFLESTFEVQKVDPSFGGRDEEAVVLAILTMVLLERSRG